MMTIKESQKKFNPCSCYKCDCYDEDLGCTMPSIDRIYACVLEENNVRGNEKEKESIR